MRTVVLSHRAAPPVDPVIKGAGELQMLQPPVAKNDGRCYLLWHALICCKATEPAKEGFQPFNSQSKP
jgi:hypothetical protein